MQKNVDAILVGLEKTTYLITGAPSANFSYSNGIPLLRKPREIDSPALHGNLEVSCQSYHDAG